MNFAEKDFAEKRVRRKWSSPNLLSPNEIITENANKLQLISMIDDNNT